MLKRTIGRIHAEGQMILRHLVALSCVLASGALAFAAEKSPAPLSKTYDQPIERVYAAMVQVASADYNLKSAVKEGYTASFYTGGQFSLVLNAICREAEENKTVVSLRIAQAVGNPQLFGVGKAMNKEAERFWNELDKAVVINQTLKSDSAKPAHSQPPAGDETAQVTVKSTPDGADITLDGKFAGSTPSTFQLRPGDHSVRIELNGFVPWDKSLTVTAGGQITLNANLQKESPDTPK